MPSPGEWVPSVEQQMAQSGGLTHPGISSSGTGSIWQSVRLPPGRLRVRTPRPAQLAAPRTALTGWEQHRLTTAERVRHPVVVAQSGRAPRCQRGGRGFDPRSPHDDRSKKIRLSQVRFPYGQASYPPVFPALEGVRGFISCLSSRLHSSAGRALPWYGRGRRFESCCRHNPLHGSIPCTD